MNIRFEWKVIQNEKDAYHLNCYVNRSYVGCVYSHTGIQWFASSPANEKPKQISRLETAMLWLEETIDDCPIWVRKGDSVYFIKSPGDTVTLVGTVTSDPYIGPAGNWRVFVDDTDMSLSRVKIVGSTDSNMKDVIVLLCSPATCFSSILSTQKVLLSHVPLQSGTSYWFVLHAGNRLAFHAGEFQENKIKWLASGSFTSLTDTTVKIVGIVSADSVRIGEEPNGMYLVRPREDIGSNPWVLGEYDTIHNKIKLDSGASYPLSDFEVGAYLGAASVFR